MQQRRGARILLRTSGRNRLLLGALLALCASIASPLAIGAEKLKVGYNLWVGSAGVFVAQEKGYYKEAGLDVAFVPFKGPGDTLPALMGEHIDIALTTADNVVLVDAKSAAGLTIIYATDTSSGADAIVAKKAVSSLAALKGKTIAVTQGEVNELLLLKALEAAGMKPGDIKSVNMDPDTAGAAFVAGSVDAAVTWEPWISRAVASGDGKVAFSSAQAPNLILDVIAVKPSVLKARQKAIAAFLAATDQGTRFVAEHPDPAFPMVAKWLEVSPLEVKGMLAGVKLYDARENATLFQAGVPARTLDVITAFYLERKAIAQTVKGRDMIDASLLSPH